MNPKLKMECHLLCMEAQALKERMFRSGLYKSGQAMDRVTTEIGYEVARLEQTKRRRRGALHTH